MKRFFKTREGWYFGDFKIEPNLASLYELDEECGLRVKFPTLYESSTLKVIDVILHEFLYAETWHSPKTDSIRPILVIQTNTEELILSWVCIEWSIETGKILSVYELSSIILTFPCVYQHSFVKLKRTDTYERSNGKVHVCIRKSGEKRTMTFPYVWWYPYSTDKSSVKWG